MTQDDINEVLRLSEAVEQAALRKQQAEQCRYLAASELHKYLYKLQQGNKG